MTIRKFEQEAIVNQIMEGVKERLDNKVEKARKSKDYKAIEKLANVVLKINKERDLLEKNMKKLLNELILLSKTTITIQKIVLLV